MCSNIILTFSTALLLILQLSDGVKGINENRRQLYRDHVDPAAGGKIPESYKFREKLNQIDAAALSNPDAKKLAVVLRNTYLPEKTEDGHKGELFPNKNSGSVETGNSESEDGLFSFPSTMIKFPSADFGKDFSFNPAFDADKIVPSNFEPSSPEVTFPGPSTSSFGDVNKEANFNSLDGGFGGGGIKDDKPHLYTKDPYAHVAFPEQDLSYKPPPEPYNPEPYEPEQYEPEPYKPEPYEPEPYVPPSNSYHEPEPYHPPGNTYHEPEPYQPAYEEPEVGYEPPHDSYGAPPPSDSYGAPPPYKPVGPILLERRPYEPTEIKPVIIATEQTYTSFDCRKVPYPDKYYADPEAGCTVYHFCNSDGRQDTFHCGYGTVFNEYLGTCDHKQAVYCKGGEGFKPPTPNYKPPTAYHEPEPYHDPEPYHEPKPFHSPRPFGFEETEFRSSPRQSLKAKPLNFGFDAGFDDSNFGRPPRRQQQQQQGFGSGFGFDNSFDKFSSPPRRRRQQLQQQQQQQQQQPDDDEVTRNPGFGFGDFPRRRRQQQQQQQQEQDKDDETIVPGFGFDNNFDFGRISQ